MDHSNYQDIKHVDQYNSKSETSLLLNVAAHCSDSANWSIEVRLLRNATCFGVNDGAAQVIVKGNDPLLSFKWDNLDFSKESEYQQLSAGIHTITVRDSRGYLQTDTFYVGVKYQIQAKTEVISDAFSEDIPNGTAMVRLAPGEEGSFTFTWNTKPKQHTPVARNLAPGMYTVVIRDQRGCEAMEAVSIIDQSGEEEQIEVDQLLTQMRPQNISTEDVIENHRDFHAYPNPTKGLFYITSSTQLDHASIKILDMQGRTISHRQHIQGYQSMINLSDAPTGIYFLQLKINTGDVMQKKIIVR